MKQAETIQDLTNQDKRKIFQSWSKARLQQYADRKRISIREAILHLVKLPSFEAARDEVDKLVDPMYHSSKEPE